MAQSNFSDLGPLKPRVRSSVCVPLTLKSGETVSSQLISFADLSDVHEHFAIRLGPATSVPLLRLHSECVTGDVFGSARCDCGPQLNESLRLVNLHGGFVLYLRQEGRGIGLYRKLDAYLLQDDGHDTYAANRMLGYKDDERNYDVAAEMLKALQVKRVRLITNNPDKRAQLVSAGIDVVEMVSTGVFLNVHNRRYLEAKVQHTSHQIDLVLGVQ